MHTDFLLAVLRSIIKRRKDLKVIIMSATIELERFSAYFNKYETWMCGLPVK